MRKRVLLVEYEGHVPSNDSHVRETETMLASVASPVGLCFDLSAMRSFHPSHVLLHGHAFKRLRHRLGGMAIVGAPPAARFGAVTVSLVSKIPLQSFDEREDAVAWLESLVFR